MTVQCGVVRVYSGILSGRRVPAQFFSVLLLAGLLGGCSMSMPLGSVFGGRDDSRDITGSVTQGPAAPMGTVTSAPLAPVADAASAPASTSAVGRAAAGPTERASLSSADWSYARGALGLALTGPETGPPVPWANPDTGTRGNFAPAAPAVVQGGVTCRDFVASRVDNGREARLQGKACRNPAGHWDISEVRSDAVAPL